MIGRMSQSIRFPSWPLDRIRALAAERGMHVWPVGGLVRDRLLGRETHDWDLVVPGDALKLARAVADDLGGAFYPLDQERDTGRVVLRRKGQALNLDFAALRAPDLEADLRLRDFTINAMAVGPDGELIDPTGGQADLVARLVRATSEAAFDLDPLRMLRAVRLKAELGLRLEAKTAAWIIERAATLGRASPERMRDEFVRIMAAPLPADHVHMLDELDLLAQLLPELPLLKEQRQSPPHRFDVWWHTLLVVEAADGLLRMLAGERPTLSYVDASERVWVDAVERLGRFAPAVAAHMAAPVTGGIERRVLFLLAALLHDIAKPLTCSEDEDGRLHFYGHEPQGAVMARERLIALRFSRAATERVATVISAHLWPGHLARSAEGLSRRAAYRFFRATGDAGIDVALLSLADHISVLGPGPLPESWPRRLGVTEALLGHYFEQAEEVVAPPPLIGGHDLMDELGLRPGPEVGRLLEAVREAQAAGEVHTRQEALALARALLGKGTF
jgi:putative nucleotidyltransferase with HDIG domain